MDSLQTKRQIPIQDGLWEVGQTSKEIPHLIGSKCTHCGEIYFPQKVINHCIQCHKRCLQKTILSNRGKVVSFAVVERAPAGGFYKGPIPYAYGFVKLTDNARIKTLFTGKIDQLEIGMDVELIIETLFVDEDGYENVTYKFKKING